MTFYNKAHLRSLLNDPYLKWREGRNTGFKNKPLTSPKSIFYAMEGVQRRKGGFKKAETSKSPKKTHISAPINLCIKNLNLVAQFGRENCGRTTWKNKINRIKNYFFLGRERVQWCLSFFFFGELQIRAVMLDGLSSLSVISGQF